VSYEAKIIADSISSAGVRLTTLQITFPRFILAEFNTHRAFSRNSASSRAIPVRKRIQQIMADPFIPEQFGCNQKGMQANSDIDAAGQEIAHDIWTEALDAAIHWANELADLDVHKQHANRLLEPFAWHTVVVTATDWDNFFHLRVHPDAQPEFQKIAGMMRDVMRTTKPSLVEQAQWHLPYITEDDRDAVLHEGGFDGLTRWGERGVLALISSARCARVSYLTHEGKHDLAADKLLGKKLLLAGHMSPFEHPATPMDTATEYYGNFKGWCSYRKLIPGESDILGYRNDSTQQ
jgi:hypothetical protein